MTAINPTSRWDAGDYARHAGFVPALGVPVVELLAPRQGERILDLGCGDGVLTERIAAAGAEVRGIDASRAMIDAARARGLDAAVGDGQALAFADEFDAVFSNAALHWMLDARAVAAGVHRALRTGGRFVGEMGGHGNIATLRAALLAELTGRGYAPPPGGLPQWYPTPDAFRAIYAEAGFTDIEARLIPRPTPLPTGVTGWLATFRAGFLDAAGVPAAEQADLAHAVEERLRPVFWSADSGWTADYVRLRFRMRKA